MFHSRLLLSLVSLFVTSHILGQVPQTVAQNESILVVDSTTQETIQKLLLIPFYSTISGAFVIPEGPAKTGKENLYFGNPVVYRTGTKLPIKRGGSFSGLPLLFAYVGKFTSFEGVLAVAPGYRPYFCKEYACLDFAPRFEMTKITNEEWDKILTSELKPLVDKSSNKIELCITFRLQQKCEVETKIDTKSRELLQTFLKRYSTKRLSQT